MGLTTAVTFAGIKAVRSWDKVLTLTAHDTLTMPLPLHYSLYTISAHCKKINIQSTPAFRID
jgi:hypothetical protein